MKNIFILGSKGIPANYGGFETFVENLTQKKVSKNIKYYVACMANDENVLEYNDSICFHVKVPEIGSAKAVYYDLLALKKKIIKLYCLYFSLSNRAFYWSLQKNIKKNECYIDCQPRWS